MEISKNEYSQLAKEVSPKSPIVKDCIFAFLIGGLICLLGQFLNYIYLKAGLTKEIVEALVPVTLVGLSAIFTGFGLYGKIAKFAGGGTLVPITGFANAMVSPAIEFKAEGHVTGIGVKLFTIAGPVIVFSVVSSAVYGLILWIFKLF